MENHSQENNESFSGKAEAAQSDAEKLAHRHLAGRRQVITGQEIQNICVGTFSSPDQSTEEAIREAKDKIADYK